MRYGVATGIVQVVRPVVDVPRSGLLVPCPPFWAAGHEYPLRSEYSEHFVARNALGLINDQQVDQPIDQRKFLPRESAGRDLAVDSFGQKHFAGRVDVACVPVEAVNLVTGVDSQGSSEFSFATAQVDDQAASDLGLFNQRPGFIGGGGVGQRRGGPCKDAAGQEGVCEPLEGLCKCRHGMPVPCGSWSGVITRKRRCAPRRGRLSSGVECRCGNTSGRCD